MRYLSYYHTYPLYNVIYGIISYMMSQVINTSN
nr:MAG TPA: hypothetical protein [Podoviridae sp. ctfN46]DAS65901.1 MAG TPA: hypothetical protein [Caudoviricetes sp.]